MTRTVTADNLGAWLLRCSPRNEPELPQWVAAGEHRIRRWCVVDNYRSRMMAVGDRVVFWVSGDQRLLDRGIWGIGDVVGVRGVVQPATMNPRSGPANRTARPNVDVDIPLLTEAVSDRAIRAAGIDDLEVQVQPQGANPSWISTGQFARLVAALPTLSRPRAPVTGPVSG